jgi:hypothetical protein
MITKAILSAVVFATLAKAADFTSVTNRWRIQQIPIATEMVESRYARGAYTSTPPYVVYGDPVQNLWNDLQAQNYPGTTDTNNYCSGSAWFQTDFVDASNTLSQLYYSLKGTSLWYAATGYTNGLRRAVEYDRTNDWRDYVSPMYRYGFIQRGDVLGPWIPYDLQSVFGVQTNAALDMANPFGAYGPEFAAIGGTVTNLFWRGEKATNEAWSVAWGNLTPVGSEYAIGITNVPGILAVTRGQTEIIAQITRATIPVRCSWLNIPTNYATRAYMAAEFRNTYFISRQEDFIDIGYVENKAYHVSERVPFVDGVAVINVFTNELPYSMPPAVTNSWTAYVLIDDFFPVIVMEINPPYIRP